MKIVGLLVMINSLVLTAWWLCTDHLHKGWAAVACLIAVFVGIFLFLHERVTEISINSVGKIKAAAEQVSVDAKTVADLTKRVEAQSATVDLVAHKAAQAEKLSQELAGKSDEAERQLAELSKAIREANANLERTKRLTDFTAIVTAAQNDNRKAFEQLRKWGEDKTFEYQELAHQAWFAILEKHNPRMYTTWSYPTEDTHPLAEAETAVILRAYWNAPIHARPSLIYLIVQRRDIPQMERLGFLVDVIKKETHLLPMEHAGRLLSKAGKATLKPLAIDELLALWEQHKEDETFWLDPAQK